MPNLIKLKRGNKQDLPILQQGEPGFTLDTKELFIGDGTSNIKIASDSDVTAHNTSSSAHSDIRTTLGNKVDKVSGKGLSTNDYTTAEKTKLSGIATGAEVNQNAFSNVKVGSTTVAADSKTDTLEIVAGSNVTITPDATNDKITIASKDTVYTHPNSGVTAGTYPKVTVNAQGHVTGSASLVAGDIPTLTASKISDFDTQVRKSALNQMAVPTADVSMNSKKVTNVATGTSNTDAVNVGQLNTAIDNATSGVSNSIHAPVQNLAAAKAIPAVERADKMLLNIEDIGLYRWDAQSTSASNDNSVIRPTDITADSTAGRWIKMSSSINDHNALNALQGGTTGEYNHLTNAQVTKLNGIATGAEVNQNAFSNVKVGSTTVAADSKTDTLELVAGSNITITPDATNDKITISSTGAAYVAGTGLALSGTTFNHKNAVTAGSTTSSAGALSHGGALTIPKVTFDAQGHITAVSTTACTLPAQYAHPTTDGNKHVPANGTSNNGKYLQATGTAGTYQWASLPVGSTSVSGIVPLNDSLTSTSVTHAATANAVKKTHDLIQTRGTVVSSTSPGKGNWIVPIASTAATGNKIFLESSSIENSLTATEAGKILDASQGKILNDRITQVQQSIPTKLPANGGNADTVDGKHAADFAGATTVNNEFKIGRYTHFYDYDDAGSESTKKKAYLRDGVYTTEFSDIKLGSLSIKTEIDSLKSSVSSGKTDVANAITAKGVSTSTTAEFATMAANIGKISSNSVNDKVAYNGTAIGLQYLPVTYKAVSTTTSFTIKPLLVRLNVYTGTELTIQANSTIIYISANASEGGQNWVTLNANTTHRIAGGDALKSDLLIYNPTRATITVNNIIGVSSTKTSKFYTILN